MRWWHIQVNIHFRLPRNFCQFGSSSEKLFPNGWRSPLNILASSEKETRCTVECAEGAIGVAKFKRLLPVLVVNTRSTASLNTEMLCLAIFLCISFLYRKLVKLKSFTTFKIRFRKSFSIRVFQKPSRSGLFPLDCSSIQRRRIHSPNRKQLPAPLSSLLSFYTSRIGLLSFKYRNIRFPRALSGLVRFIKPVRSMHIVFLRYL